MNKKHVQLEKRAKEVIMQKIANNPSMTREELKEELKPHFCFEYDPKRAYETALNKKVNQLVASYRDKNGVRNSYSCKIKESKYVNIDNTTDDEELQAVENQLLHKYDGIGKGLSKVQYIRSILKGQLKLEAVK